MALSGSVNYSLDRDSLILEAYQSYGEIESGGTATTSQLTEGATTLNIMLKNWLTIGVNLWVLKRESITPVLDQQSYTLGATGNVIMDRPMDVLEGYRRTTADVLDVPMTKISRQEYWNLSDKDASGTPLNFYYDPQLTNGVLYVWPTADATFVSNNTLEFIYRKPFDDMDSSTDDFEFPVEWLEPIKYNLAYRLALKVGAPEKMLSRIERIAVMSLKSAMEWDTEHASIFLQVDPMGGY